MIPSPLHHTADFRAALLSWYDANLRDLPWRNTKDPFAIWVSEVMLQQTRVTAVIPYYKRFLSRYPDITALANANGDDLLKLWEGLGYYTRIRNLHKAAKIVRDEHNGTIPDTFTGLLSLPGIGDYIASAVSSIAFGLTEAVVDGNVKRVFARLFTDPVPVNQPRSHKVIKAYATKLLDGDRPGDFNQAMMELGATICTPQTPLCALCPIKKFCAAFSCDRVSDFPVREKKKAIPFYPIACGAVLHKDGRVLVTKRPEEGFLGGFWEFPGGKIQKGETAKEAAKRELLEETGLLVTPKEDLITIRHAYTHFKIELTLWICALEDAEKKTVSLNGPVAWRWVEAEELDQLAFPGANRKFIPLLQERIKAYRKGVTPFP